MMRHFQGLAAFSSDFLFRMEASAKREGVVPRTNGLWKGRKKNKRGEVAFFFLPAFLCAQIFIEREASAYEAEDLSTATSFFLRLFFRRHFAGKPVVASRNAAVSSG